MNKRVSYRGVCNDLAAPIADTPRESAKESPTHAAIVVLVATLGLLSGSLAYADQPSSILVEAEAAAARHNRLFERSMFAFRAIHAAHGKAMRVAASLKACQLPALATQVEPSKESIGETLQAYLAKDAPQDMDLFFDLFAMVQSTAFYYEHGYSEGAKLIPDENKDMFCSVVTKKANELLAQSQLKMPAPD